MEQTTEPEDTTSLDETLEVIKRNMKNMQDSMKSAIESYQRVMINAKDEPYHEKKYRVHGLLKVWCIQHGFNNSLSIKEFLQVIFEDYGKNQRLDISQRTVKLDNDVANLLGRSKEEIMDLGDFFILVISLFEGLDHKN